MPNVKGGSPRCRPVVSDLPNLRVHASVKKWLISQCNYALCIMPLVIDTVHLMASQSIHGVNLYKGHTRECGFVMRGFAP
jgi:hypothetical protein